HCHDWQSGLIAAYLRTLYLVDSYFAKTGSLFTAHNMAFQGCFPKDTIFKAGFSWSEFSPERLEYYGGINFLKAGIVYSDLITTVSPTYAMQAQSDREIGRGLEGVLKSRSSEFFGILNGIDNEVWDPMMDSYIIQGYDEESYQKGKAICKKELLALCGLSPESKLPVAGVVARFDYQKGLDIIAEIMPKLKDKMILIVLGNGDMILSELFTNLAKTFPKSVYYHQGYNDPLAHKIYAGSDIFLMPSRFEPCGLSQMIAMRYGTVPIVTRTGGLFDTVADYGKPGANGFFADRNSSQSLYEAITLALELFENKKEWHTLIQNAMRADFSWDNSAKAYMDLFSKIAEKYR
ncbi:MAG: glycogen/starch synthase, partial [Elusimicrobia bacterium]|nr:glycogen/starch synthase [Elusimicrobiota bacterium]